MKQRFETLDVFRGFAALIVAVYHFSESKGNLGNISLIGEGHRFVNFFFVLSGFIIHHNYQHIVNDYQLKDFVFKRLLRLYPLHLFMLVLFLTFEVLKAVLFQMGIFNNHAFSANSFVALLQHLFMLQGIARTPYDFTWNYPSWSISTEMFAYATFALTVIYTNRLVPKCRMISLLMVLAIALLIEILGAGYAHFIALCIFSFFLGCITNRVYFWLQTYSLTNSLYTSLEITGILTLLASVCYLHQAYDLLLSPLYAIVILIFAAEKGKLSRLITNIYTVWLGTLSYSIYMTHALIASVLKVVLINILNVSDSAYDFSSILFLIIVISFSFHTYRYIETKGRVVLTAIFAY
ncbi:acyltransferase [Spirosoma knui]